MKYRHTYLLILSLMAWAFFLGFARGCSAEEIDMEAIAMIESSGNHLRYNTKENAVGLYQIRIGALKDYNMAHLRETYSHEEMYEPDKAYIVANWYFNKKIPGYLKAYDIKDTTENRIIAYNFGIGNLRKYLAGEKELPQITKNYIEKYRRLTND